MTKIKEIKQGNHYCEPTILGIPLHFGISKTDLKFRFRFHSDCLYDETKVIPGWNKLFGWSGFMNHKNSVRIAWECHNGKIRLGYYFYIKGVRIDGDLCEVNPNEWHTGVCNILGDSFGVMIDDVNFKTVSGGKKPLIAWRNYFYFGGQDKSPQDMTIEIEIL